MPRGVEITLSTLAATSNEAAVLPLVAALDLPQHAISDGALSALLLRQSPAAAAEVLRRWDRLPQRWKTQIALRGDWIAGAIRKALLDSHDELRRIGCEAAIETRDYDALPLLVSAAIETSTAHADRAAKTALQLAELLAEELAGPRDYRIRRDPQMQRAHVLVCLEKAAESFPAHGRRELLEAFLLLTQRENAPLKRILQSPTDRTYSPLMDVLTHSSRQGIERLLLSFLEDPFAPLSALQAVVRRRDVAFLRRLLKRIGAEPAPVVRNNLRRIENVPWMRVNLALLDALGENEQPGAVQLAVSSGIPRQLAFEVVAYLLRHGTLAGRRAAAKALAQFPGPSADDLAVRTLDDEDAQVRSAVAAQLRKRDIPSSIQKLLVLLDSPHQIERETAQAELAEFRIDRFLAKFDTLAPDYRRATGRLVLQIDPETIPALRRELAASIRSQRARALAVVQLLEIAAELESELIALLDDPDQYLRVEAIHLLAAIDTPRVREALRQAALDTQPLVQNAAETALERVLRLEPIAGDSVTAVQARLRQRVGSANRQEQVDPPNDLGELVSASNTLDEIASAGT